MRATPIRSCGEQHVAPRHANLRSLTWQTTAQTSTDGRVLGLPGAPTFSRRRSSAGAPRPLPAAHPATPRPSAAPTSSMLRAAWFEKLFGGFHAPVVPSAALL